MKVNLERLKKLRENANLTQEDVAKILGYKTSTGYHYIETGRCKLKAEQIFILAHLYKIPIDFLCS